MSSWSESRAVQKKEQPLKKGMQRKGAGSERCRQRRATGGQAELGSLECVRTWSVSQAWRVEGGEAEKWGVG